MAFIIPRFVPSWVLSLCWTGFILWAGAITFLSSLSPDQLNLISQVKFWDKAEHFAAFALGAGLLTFALRWSLRWPALWIGAAALVAMSTFGAADEIHQLTTPGRSGGDLGDWFADTLGAATAVAIILVTYARYARASYYAAD